MPLRYLEKLIDSGLVLYENQEECTKGTRAPSTEDNLFVIFGGGGGEMMPDNFGATFTRFRKEGGVTIEGLAEPTDLLDRTIRRMGDPENETYSLNAVVVCVTLHLNAYQCDMMIMLVGYRLKNTKTDCLYRLFLNFAFKETVLDCNNALIPCGLKLLTKLHDGRYIYFCDFAGKRNIYFRVPEDPP